LLCLGFCWLLSPEINEDQFSQIHVPLIDDIIYSEDFVNSNFKDSYFMDKIGVTQEQIAIVAEKTTGQKDNPLWQM
jgi:hypothetical protein